jgi:glycosyltransferase involved in cell wall biosynthesis
MPEKPLFNSLSVIIPTYNREKLLAKALEAYLAQSSPQLVHELLVVDDGSTDNTESIVRGFSSRSPFPIRYLRQPNKGPAAARNLGIREAASSLVLFTDSDIVPDRELVAQHLEWHRNNPQIGTAVLGYATWPPEINATPFMRWYGERGDLFAYQRLRGKIETDFHFFYTCNLSLKTEFLRTCGYFDEDFKSAAFEDIELGVRLSEHGLRLLYNAAAVGYHHQFFTFEDACRKRRANTTASQVFLRKVKEQRDWEEVQEKPVPARRSVAKRIAIWVATSLFPVRWLIDSSLPLPGIVYDRLLRHDATRGAMPIEVDSGQRTN